MKRLTAFRRVLLTIITLALLFSSQVWAASVPWCTDLFPRGLQENARSHQQLDVDDLMRGKDFVEWPKPNNHMLGPGDFFFNGTTLGNNYRLNVSDASTRIFVNGDLTLNGKDIRLGDPDNPGHLVLVVRGRLVFDSDSDGSVINGLVYATGDISVYDPFFSFIRPPYIYTINGAITTEGRVRAKTWALIPDYRFVTNYDSNALENADLSGLCNWYSPVTQIHHFELSYDSSALTCAPEPIAVRACMNEACTNIFDGSVDVTLSPSGWIGGTTQTIQGGEEAFLLRQNDARNVTLNVVDSDTSVEVLNPTRCRVDGGQPNTNCSLMFKDSGFAFEIPDLIANKSSGAIKLRAVEKDEKTLQCVPSFENVTRPIGFYSTYVEPGSSGRVASRSVSVNHTDVGRDASGLTNLDLNFDNKGEAIIEVAYPDAGRMQLDAVYAGSVETGDEGLIMTGSDQFVSRPAGLCVRSTATCAAGNATCPKFQVAGQPFPLSIIAVGWESDTDNDFCSGNINTPSYQQSGIALSSTVMAPAGGTNGVLSKSSYDHVASSDATTVVELAQSEVGVFRITATPPAKGYMGLTVPAGESPNLGRFYPDHFGVSLETSGSFKAFCNGFSYVGQDLEYLTPPSLRIVPYNKNGQVTTNYRDAFRFLTASDVERTPPVVAENMGRSTKLSVFADYSDATLTGLEQDEGHMLYLFNMNDRFRYEKADSAGNKVANAEVAPFNSDIRLSIDRVRDKDSVQAKILPDPWSPIGIEVRYGRLQMENAFGPEFLSLPLPMRAEYYAGAGYRLNDADGCTVYDAASLAVTNGFNTEASGSGYLAGGLSPAGAEVQLSAPGYGNTGTAVLRYGAPEWLWDDWDADASLDAPAATATFGQYRGHDRIIFWREVTN